MRKDSETQAVTHMEDDEVALFVLYRSQANDPNGLTRDRLPYTPQMDHLLTQYNGRTSGGLSHNALWEKLKSVLKYGEDRIEQYLQSAHIPFPPRR